MEIDRNVVQLILALVCIEFSAVCSKLAGLLTYYSDTGDLLFLKESIDS